MEEARNDKLAEKVLSYQETKDERLAAEILKEMRPLLLSICQKFYIRGMDREDLFQEARIGLYKAMRDYRAGKGTLFRTFAIRCIQCQCISALKTANRLKQKIFLDAISLDAPVHEDNEKQTLADGIEDKCKPKPGDELIILDDARKCQSVLQRILPAYPLRVFEERAEGKSYAMIAEELGRKKKSIDNALDRAKSTIRFYMDLHDDLDIEMMGHYLLVKSGRFWGTGKRKGKNLQRAALEIVISCNWSKETLISGWEAYQRKTETNNWCHFFCEWHQYFYQES